METKQIMLVCAAGMSTSLMVNKMQKAAEERGLAATIFAVPVSEAEDYLSEKKVDVLLLGPLSVRGFTGKTSFKRYSGRCHSNDGLRNDEGG